MITQRKILAQTEDKAEDRIKNNESCLLDLVPKQPQVMFIEQFQRDTLGKRVCRANRAQAFMKLGGEEKEKGRVAA